MRSLTRGILFYSFVVVFFFAAAAILFYGLGYRYNFSKNAIERTGELIVETAPNGALATLNGERIFRFRDVIFGRAGARTPVHKKYLLPGNYHLELAKEGYMPYRRDISVTSGAVTIVPDPVLIPNAESQTIFSYPKLKKILVTATDNIIFLTETNTIIRYKVSTQEFEQIYQANNKHGITAYVSPSRQRALIVEDSSLSVVVNEIIPIADADITYPISRVLWSDDEKTMFVLTSSGIMRIDADGSQITSVAEGRFVDIGISQRTLYALQDSGKKRTVISIDAATGKRTGTQTLTLSERIAVIEAVRLPLLIGKDANGTITAIHIADAVALQTPFAQVQDFFAKTLTSIAVASEFEVMIYEKISGETGEGRLLIRQSTPIQEIAMSSDTPYVVILSAGALDAMEVVNRSDPNTYRLNSEGHDVYDFFFDSNGMLYYSARTKDGNATLYSRTFHGS